jgi:hypothetical protein
VLLERTKTVSIMYPLSLNDRTNDDQDNKNCDVYGLVASHPLLDSFLRWLNFVATRDLPVMTVVSFLSLWVWQSQHTGDSFSWIPAPIYFALIAGICHSEWFVLVWMVVWAGRRRGCRLKKLARGGEESSRYSDRLYRRSRSSRV